MPIKPSLVLNGAAALVGIVSLAFALKYELSPAQEPPCSERYPRAIRFPLDRDGQPIALDELQSQLGNRDWGLGNGSKIVKLNTGPSKFALSLDLKSAPPRGDETTEQRHGIGFDWSPSSMGKPMTACLAYSVFIPKGFVFGRGGVLPGFEGLGKKPEAASGSGPGTDDEAIPGFSTLLAVGPGGTAGVAIKVRLDGKTSSVRSEETFELPIGQWVQVEQEVALNGPQDNDGGIRAWINGKLMVEQRHVTFRRDPSVGIAGVAVQASYGERPASGTKGATNLFFSPFQIYLR